MPSPMDKTLASPMEHLLVFTLGKSQYNSQYTKLLFLTMYRVYQLVYLLQINTLPRLAKFRVCNYHKLTMFLSSNLV